MEQFSRLLVFTNLRKRILAEGLTKRDLRATELSFDSLTRHTLTNEPIRLADERFECGQNP
jgi:hypothetical protein